MLNMTPVSLSRGRLRSATDDLAAAGVLCPASDCLQKPAPSREFREFLRRMPEDHRLVGGEGGI
jgi:hypothetical protein